MKTTIAIAVASVIPFLLAACATVDSYDGPSALANLAPTKGNKVAGRVTFTPKGDRVQMVATVFDLAPGTHGFHIHEKGDCSADDATSAGGHFNPLGKPHAAPATSDRHAGDMPMLVADSYGNATLTTELDIVKVGGGGPTDVVGRAVIIHKDADDFKTQPTGNSGARVACGVITMR